MPGHNMLYVGRNRAMCSGAYVSPFLLEILSTRPGAPSFTTATGTLTANTGQTVSCSRAASGYCLGSDGLLHLLGANTVRVEPAGLLVEGQSTNGASFSQDFTNWGNAGAAGLSNQATAPDGTNTAGTITCLAGNANHIAYTGTSIPSTAPHTISVYAKAGTVNFLCIDLGNVSHFRATFDLSNGTYSLVRGPGTTATCTAVPGLAGWYRCTVTGTPGVGDGFLILGPGDTAANADQVNIGTWTATGTERVFVWQGQTETLPFATSPIITVGGSSATRDADIVTVGNVLAGLNPGTWRAGVTPRPLAPWASYPANFPSILSSPSAYPQANGWWHYMNSGVSTGTFDTYDNSTAQRFAADTISPTASDPYALLLRNVAGTLSVLKDGVVISGANSGAGTGVIATQNATLQLGGGIGGVNIGFWHLTDIYVDNT